MKQELPNTTFIVTRAPARTFESLGTKEAIARWSQETSSYSVESLDEDQRKELTPSSGFLGMYILLQLCGHVTVYGMSLDASTTRSSIKNSAQGTYHYFKRYVDSEVLLAHPHHSFDLEGNVMRHLNATDIIQLCTLYPQGGKCGLGSTFVS